MTQRPPRAQGRERHVDEHLSEDGPVGKAEVGQSNAGHVGGQQRGGDDDGGPAEGQLLFQAGASRPAGCVHQGDQHQRYHGREGRWLQVITPALQPAAADDEHGDGRDHDEPGQQCGAHLQ